MVFLTQCICFESSALKQMKTHFSVATQNLQRYCSTEEKYGNNKQEINVFVCFFLNLSSQCVHSKLCMTLSLIHQTSPRGCHELIRICLCVNTPAMLCVAVCKVIHWLRQIKYDMQPRIMFRAAQNIHTKRIVCTVFFVFFFS